jgi:transcriptional regulator with XRE-family HTH domain
MLNKNEFGTLVKAYRNQRGWTQSELAAQWGHAREYVSQVERGVRKLDSASQVARLADILGIPQEKLEAIGRGIPERKDKRITSTQNDEEVLELLLAPGRDMVRLSWLIWLADQHPAIEDNLRNLVLSLESILISYRGDFSKPAKQLLSYAHQMQGKIAFDRLDYAAAGGHFSEMLDLGQELNDPDIITLGMSHQGDVFRKRKRYQQSIQCFKASEPYAKAASLDTQGMRYSFLARAYYVQGDEENFLRSIDPAIEIASNMKDSIGNMSLQFNLDEALQYKAAGYTLLSKPERALEIYEETDKLRSFRLLRERGSYAIEKARAYLVAGELDEGIQYSLKGIEKATEYRSKMHIARLDTIYARLRILPIGKDKRLNILREALITSQQEQERW